jgi:hypothetical protein
MNRVIRVLFSLNVQYEKSTLLFVFANVVITRLHKYTDSVAWVILRSVT